MTGESRASEAITLLGRQGLITHSDEAVFEEAARRLRQQYARKNGGEFLHGRFEFIFHDGRFQGIEEHHRAKIYLSPKRFKRG